MKNRKFVGDDLQAISWAINTYTSKIFEGPHFYSEFSYSDGHRTITWGLDEINKIIPELVKFQQLATKKEQEFKESQKKGKKSGKK
jgi:hypothetical protein